jgi:membrane-associated phospholipid phosphatase
MQADIKLLLLFITDLGDSAILGTLSLMVSLCFLFQGGRRESVALLFSLIGTAAAIGIAKILLMGCGSQLRSIGIHSPSGHSALSVAVLGTFALLIRERLPGIYRYVPSVVLLSLAFMIALSRVLLKYHTVAEVALGGCIGIISLLFIWKALSRTPPNKLNPHAAVYSALVIVFMLHGMQLPAEDIIKLFAEYFKLYTHCA